jgi:lipid-A-disaccharide synthase
MNVLLSAGEVSGDIVGASIAMELRRRDPSIRIWGLGGARMQASGVEIRTETNGLGRIGVSESFSAILPFARAFADIRRQVNESAPDLAILVANDVFNAILGRWLRRRGIRTLAVFPPQVWIWRSLLRVFCPSYDTVAACFPVEQRLYSKHARTVFVGHHLADSLGRATENERASARERLDVGAEDVLVGLFPGSRLYEVSLLAPVLLDACTILAAAQPSIRFVMPVAEPEHEPVLAEEIRRRDLATRVRLVTGSHEVMRASDLLLLASGTATLEASLIGTPMIAIYRVFPLTMFIVRMAIRLGLMDSETLALPNLLLERMIVPEIRQEGLSAERVAEEALTLLNDPDRLAAMRRELALVRTQVDGEGSIARVADLVASLARGTVSVNHELVPELVEGGSR